MRLARNLIPANEDQPPGWLNPFSVWVLLGLMLMLNVGTNYRRWLELELLKPVAMEQSTGLILTIAALLWLMFLGWIVWRQQRGKIDLLPASPLGQSQLLAVVVMFAVMLLYMLLPSLRLPTWLMIFTALVIGALCIVHSKPSAVTPLEPVDALSSRWNPGWGFFVSCICLPLLLVVLGMLSVNIPRP